MEYFEDAVKNNFRNIEYSEKTTVEVLYYISSLFAPENDPCDLFAKAVRKHWSVESCH